MNVLFIAWLTVSLLRLLRVLRLLLLLRQPPKQHRRRHLLGNHVCSAHETR